MPDAAAPDAKASDKIVTAQDRRTWRVMGGFITAVGVGVVAIAIATLRTKWIPQNAFAFDPLYLQPYLLLAPVAVAAFAAFRALNPPIPDDPPPRLPRPPIPGSLRGPARRTLEERYWNEDEEDRARRRHAEIRAQTWANRRYLPWAAGAVVVAVVLLLILALAARRTPDYDLFALTLPTPAPAAADGPSQTVRINRTASSVADRATGETRASSTEVTQQSANPGPTRHAVMMWWVRKPQPQAPSGLLPMALGGVFLCAFGAYFPRISLTAANSSLGFLEKAVAPALSLALVGIGASQQVQAERAKQDIRLAEKGLPAVVSLDRRDVELRNAAIREREVYALEREQLSPEALERLEKSISELSDTLRKAGERGAGGTDLRLIERQLQPIVIRGPGPPTPAPDANLGKIATAAAALDDKAKTELDAADKRRNAELTRNCALLEIDDAQTAARIRELRAIAARKKAERDKYNDRKGWKIFFVKPENGDAESNMADQLAAGAKADRELRMQAVCPKR